jgi:hypothetical protein
MWSSRPHDQHRYRPCANVPLPPPHPPRRNLAYDAPKNEEVARGGGCALDDMLYPRHADDIGDGGGTNGGKGLT